MDSGGTTQHWGGRALQSEDAMCRLGASVSDESSLTVIAINLEAFMNTLHSKHFNIIYIENKDGLSLVSLCRGAGILT